MIAEILDFIKQEAALFGANEKSYVLRKNIGSEALTEGGAYFGLISEEENPSGPYSDFSMVIFPSEFDGGAWLVCLGVGSVGFKNDYELSKFPGVKRLFARLTQNAGYSKNDFSDIENPLPKSFLNNPKIAHLKKSITQYSKVLQACEIVESPNSKQGKEIVSAFIAAYAKLRDWPTNKSQRNAVDQALSKYKNEEGSEDEKDLTALLNIRRFIVVEGPPGTGKTRLAKQIASNFATKTFFTQFHAETTFSDFIYGLRPDVKSNNLKYIEHEGTFTESLKYAINNPSENVLLIIDEINRANLSNILGPIFYLFEHKMDNESVQIEINPGYTIQGLPSNFYVIATMNTADRSLAVVDFALRRRFAWYRLKPKRIESLRGNKFYSRDFDAFKDIFDWHASSAELSLQPGQGYFIAESDEEMQMRVRYELFPLIKEYLAEGLLRSATEEFNMYFLERIGLNLFE